MTVLYPNPCYNGCVIKGHHCIINMSNHYRSPFIMNKIDTVKPVLMPLKKKTKNWFSISIMA